MSLVPPKSVYRHVSLGKRQYGAVDYSVAYVLFKFCGNFVGWDRQTDTPRSSQKPAFVLSQEKKKNNIYINITCVYIRQYILFK
jgi:hypothetical protein